MPTRKNTTACIVRPWMLRALSEPCLTLQAWAINAATPNSCIAGPSKNSQKYSRMAEGQSRSSGGISIMPIAGISVTVSIDRYAVTAKLLRTGRCGGNCTASSSLNSHAVSAYTRQNVEICHIQ